MAVPVGHAGRIGLRNRNENEVPRGILFLHNETGRRENQRRLWFALAGSTGTGKSTLATRFTVMDRNELNPNDVVYRNSYRFTVNLNSRPQVNRSGLVHVGIYIDSTPHPEVTLEELYQVASLRAIIFLFDLNENRTLKSAIDKFDYYRWNEDENMHPFILVGNKIDVRDDPRYDLNDLPSDAVSTLYGSSVARSMGALGYYECSALLNIGVGPVLDKIIELIMR